MNNSTIITEADLTQENTNHWTSDYHVSVKSHDIAWTEGYLGAYGHEKLNTYNSTLFYHLRGSQLVTTIYSYPKKQQQFHAQIFDLSQCSLVTKLDVERQGPLFCGPDRGRLRGEAFFFESADDNKLPYRPMFVVRITEKPTIYDWQEFLSFSGKLKTQIKNVV